MSEPTRPTAIAILGEGYTIAIAPEATSMRDTIIEAARRVVAVTDQDSCDIAQARLKGLAAIRNSVEASRTEVKKPVLELGRKIDGLAKDFVADVITEEARLSILVTDYAREQQRIARVAREKAALRAEQVTTPSLPALPTGVREDIDFEVTDAAAFYTAFPQFCEITVKRAPVIAALKKSFAKKGALPEVAGLRVFQNLKPKGR